MDQFVCEACSTSFSSKGSRKQHYLKCKAYLLQLSPSFKTDIPAKKYRARSKIIGTYEWAITKSCSKNSHELMLALDEKYTRIDLEKEILRAERKIAFNDSVSEMAVNRQIVVCRVLKKKIERDIKKQAELDTQKKQKAQRRRDKAQGSALGGVFDTKYSLFVSGGAPGLGKRA
ncbi:TPA: hypothetical protein P0E28_005212 [Vibrio campbellii]|nr:hypothetical protein [Vibrio campbellii]